MGRKEYVDSTAEPVGCNNGKLIGLAARATAGMLLLLISFFFMNSSSTTQNSNLWFTISIGLMGLILGYMIAVLGNGMSSRGVANQGNPNVPSVPSVPSNPVDVPAVALEPVPPVDPEEDHILGPASAKVTLIQYMDYECPFCKRHHDTMLALRKMYPNDVNFVMRHFPLNFHQNAQKQAEAVECVGKIAGNTAFWKFSDLLITRTTAGGTGFALADLPALAKESGANEAKFVACLDSGEFAQKVLDQQQAGQAAGINGTPGNVIVNNTTKETKLIPGAVPLTTMSQAIDAILGKKS